MTDDELLEYARNELAGTSAFVPPAEMGRLRRLGWVLCPICGNWTPEDEVVMDGENDGCNWCPR